MMTFEEQEKKVFEEIQHVKTDVENIIGYKINKKNFKKAIIEMTKKAANEGDILSKLPVDSQERIQTFFTNCQNFLGEVIWKDVKNKNIKIFISYEDKPLTSWNIPVDTFFAKSDTFDVSLAMLTKSVNECFIAYFLSPILRQQVMDGDEATIKVLYDSFSRASMISTLNNLIMLRDNFPEFYNHITTKLDIMTIEDMQQFIHNKNGTRKSNQIRQGKKKRVSRVKKI